MYLLVEFVEVSDGSNDMLTLFRSIHIRTVSSWRLLSTLHNQMKLDEGPFGHSNMQSTLDFYHRPARKEINKYTTT